MLTKLLATGLLAGVLAGVLVSALQHQTTVPLILEAEVYEKAADKKPAAHHHSALQGAVRAAVQSAEVGERNVPTIFVHETKAAEDNPEQTAEEDWEPHDGLERTAYTTLSTVGSAVGCSLMVIATMVASGVMISARSGLLWGVAAFLATGLAPALGLPPELPGSAAADLFARQVWWIGTAFATAAGIYLLMRVGSISAIASGLAAIVLPHILGAPQAHAFANTAPAELAGHFAAASLVVHAVLWMLVGAFSGVIWQRLSATAEPERAA